MSEKKTKAQVIKKGIARAISWTIITFLALALGLVLLLQVPSFQTYVVKKVASYLTEKTGFETTLTKVSIKWLDEIELEGLQIRDTQDSLMLGTDKILIDFNITDLLSDLSINLDEVRIEKLKVQLINNAEDGDLNINEFIKRISSLAKPSDTTATTKPFEIDQIRLLQADFIMSNPSLDTIDGGIDYNHLHFAELFGDVRSLRISNDTVEFRILALEGFEPETGFRINNLRTNFHYSNTKMGLTELNLSAGTSVIKDSLVFRFNNPSNLSYFIDSVSIEANLNNTRIYSEDLALFAPALAGYDQFFILDGIVSGPVSNISMNDFRIGFGRASHVSGNLSFEGLPDIDNTFVFANLLNSSVVMNDLSPYLDRETLKQIAPLGRVNFTGEFIGLFQDFVANGKFKTAIGNIDSDINMKLIPGQIPQYKGALALQNFNLGRLINDTENVGSVSMKGNIEGKGFTQEDADVLLDASFTKLGLLGYDYTNITTDIRFADNLFQGDIDINDPNLKFTATAFIDLRNNLDLINITAQLDTAFLRELNLTEEDIFISTRLYTDLRGLQIDSLTGYAEFLDNYIIYNGRSLSLDSLEFQSIKKNQDRQIRLSSSLFDAEIFGQFNFTTIVEDAQIYAKEIELALINDQEAINEYYAEKKLEVEAEYYRADFTFNLKDANPIIQLFDPYIYLSENTRVEGSFINGYTSMFALNSDIETIRIGTNTFNDNLLDINTSKIADSTDILASAYIESRRFDAGNDEGTLENMYVNLIWSEKKIDFSSRIVQAPTNSIAEVFGSINLLREGTEIKFLPSNLLALDQNWQFADNNRIFIAGREIDFENLRIVSQDQSISLIGSISEDPSKILRLEMDNFQIENLNPFSPYPFFGTADGYLNIQDFYFNQKFDTNLNILKFSIDKFLAGDVSLVSEWNTEEQLVEIALGLERDSRKVIAIDGFYYPNQVDNQLNLVANLDNANINIAEPFLAELFSEMAGTATGQIRISGSLDSPVVQGTGKINDGKMKFNYLNTVYNIDGSIVFDQNEIGFRGLTLVDKDNNRGQINGGIFHDGFKDFIVDLRGTMDNLLVLNTTLRENELYYGTAVATGTFSVLGPFSNLEVNVRATTNKGTNLFIPISSSSSVEQSEFIHFVDFRDSLVLAEINMERDVVLSGLRLNFDIAVTPDAYAEIIFDQKAGDIIRARGRGNLKLQIDTNGQFNMFGDYEITEGAYNFTLYGIINKEFIVEPGSKISWLGDPYEAILDIQASYRQMASLSPLIRNESALNDPAVQRRYPTRVTMDLTGSMLAPDIKFGIAIDEYPQGNIELETLVSSFKFRLENDEQELNRQVFSLIILRKFSPENSFDTGGGGGFGRSVSEFFSSQLSHYVSQIDENLEVNIDLAGLDEQALNTFQLRLSYTFLNGRLRITRDGAITNLSNEVDVTSLAGDWTAEYLLSADGAFRVKIFSRTNLNMASTALNNTATTTGISLMYTQSFDKLNELFSSIRGRNRREAIRRESLTEEELETEKNETSDRETDDE